MKWIVPVIALILGVVSIVLPTPPQPEAGPAPGTVTPPLAVCPTEEGGTRTSEIDIVSTVAGPGAVTLFSGGNVVGRGEFETGASGSSRLAVSDIAAVGRASALVEFPASESASASITRGETLVSAETCSRVPDQQVVIGGGSTIEDRIFQVQLMNPYSTSAVADITAVSESGRESVDGLRAIVVPARSSVVVDVGSILPGRESLNLVIEAVRGNVVASATLEEGPDQAMWRAVAPEEIWYVPVPVFGGSRQIVIASSTPTEVTYQVDVFGPGGLEEAALEGTVSGGGQTIVDLSELTQAAIALRVVATAPVGVFARLSSETALGMGTASPAPASEWLLPGAGFGTQTTGKLTMVNVGVEPTDVTVNELREDSRSVVVTIQPNEVIEIEFDGQNSHGVSITSDGDVVPFWLTRRREAIAISGGYPLIADG